MLKVWIPAFTLCIFRKAFLPWRNPGIVMKRPEAIVRNVLYVLAFSLLISIKGI
jgi:hypothetical protein